MPFVGDGDRSYFARPEPNNGLSASMLGRSATSFSVFGSTRVGRSLGILKIPRSTLLADTKLSSGAAPRSKDVSGEVETEAEGLLLFSSGVLCASGVASRDRPGKARLLAEVAF